MQSIESWITDWITGWDSLATAVMILALATIGATYIGIRNTKKITMGLDKIASGLDNITSRLDSNTTALKNNASELLENHEAIEKNMASLDDIRKTLSTWNWWKWR